MKNMELNNDNFNQLPSTENSGGQENKSRIFWWLGLFLAVIIILTTVVWIVEREQGKKVVDDRNLPVVNQETEKNGEEKKMETLVRYGKMSLKGTPQTVKPGEKIIVNILIDTKTPEHPEIANIVLAAARLVYSADKLTLEKIDSKNSVLPMSIVQNKSTGKVEIVRGVAGNANPEDTDNGYTGTGGLVVSLEFMAKESGSAIIEFLPEESSLLLDDGLGTKMILDYENYEIKIK